MNEKTKKIGLISIPIVILLIIWIVSVKPTDMRKDIINHFENYVKKHNIKIDYNKETAFHLKEIGYKLNNKCYEDGLIIVKNNDYKVYYVCDTKSEDLIKLNQTNQIVLNGSNPQYIKYGESYNEYGYTTASDYLVTTKNNIENKIGMYYVDYEAINQNSKLTSRRIVIVTKKDFDSIPFIKLDNNITIKKGSLYKEPGYTAYDSKDGDITHRVIIDGTVNTDVVGDYKITYKVTNSSGKTIQTIRNVKVVVDYSEVTFDYNLSVTTPTNQPVEIDATITGSGYDFLLDPDGNITKENSYKYTATVNDDYIFYIKRKDGRVEEKVITITNIDTEKPTGICKNTIDNGKSKIDVTAQDNVGIASYSYTIDGVFVTSGTNNTYSHSKSSRNAVVTVYDTAGNYQMITCSIPYEPPIVITSSSLIDKYEGETLKYYVEDMGKYYVSHIWALDPYTQFKMGMYEVGTLKTAQIILNKEINQHQYQNKALIAVNASGFVSFNFSIAYYRLNKNWLNSSLSPIILYDGKVVRDLTATKLNSDMSIITFGLAKDGNLKAYGFNHRTDNKAVANQMQNDGVKYKFAFGPVLVKDGKIERLTTDPNIRQGLCQIDKNNFVFITNHSSRASGFSLKALGNYMISLGCKTGFNIDGGGSTNLLYKKTDNNVIGRKVASREIADIIYFVE